MHQIRKAKSDLPNLLILKFNKLFHKSDFFIQPFHVLQNMKNKVFVVVEGTDYESQEIEGIFSSRDNALKYIQIRVNYYNTRSHTIEKPKYQYKQENENTWRKSIDYFQIQEHVLDDELNELHHWQE